MYLSSHSKQRNKLSCFFRLPRNNNNDNDNDNDDDDDDNDDDDA